MDRVTEKSWFIISLEFIYSTLVIIFIFNLIALNKILLDNFEPKDYWGILAYNDNQPVSYFFMAFILFLMGGVGIFFLIRHFFRNNLTDDERLVIFFSNVVNILCMYWIFHHINIPIFKAILMAVGVGTIGAVFVMNRQS